MLKEFDVLICEWWQEIERTGNERKMKRTSEVHGQTVERNLRA